MTVVNAATYNVLIVLACFWAGQADPGDGGTRLQYELTTRKRDYLPFEPVVARLIVRNTAPLDLTVAYDRAVPRRLRIVRPDGVGRMTGGRPSRDDAFTRTIVLQPGAALWENILLHGRGGDQADSAFFFPSTGVYHLEAGASCSIRVVDGEPSHAEAIRLFGDPRNQTFPLHGRAPHTVTRRNEYLLPFLKLAQGPRTPYAMWAAYGLARHPETYLPQHAPASAAQAIQEMQQFRREYPDFPALELVDYALASSYFRKARCEFDGLRRRFPNALPTRRRTAGTLLAQEWAP